MHVNSAIQEKYRCNGTSGDDSEIFTTQSTFSNQEEREMDNPNFNLEDILPGLFEPTELIESPNELVISK